ncbi:MAG: HAMP domain-containing sensor histidine kinase [Ignavibacteriaceae bacterium]|jgi:signal transduction histidine kinase
MIDLKGTKILFTAYAHYYSQFYNCGFYSDDLDIPNYLWISGIKPESCKLLDDNMKINQQCHKFYSNLDIGIKETICPLGVTIRYNRVKTASGTFTMMMQKEYNQEITKNVVSKLPRKTKKALKKKLHNGDIIFNITNINDDTIIDNFSNVVETVLAGRLSESMRAITHEMLTPIQGVINDIKLLKSQVDENKESLDTIKILEQNIGQISRLSKNISILLNPQLNITVQSARKVYIHSEIKNIWERYTSATEGKKIILDHKKNKGGLYIEAVPDQIGILFNILLENAIKYSFEGFDNKPTKIIVSYKDLKNFLEVTIETLGCLIEVFEYERVFELGYRGINSNERFRNGTGSGLYIAKNIVTSHGGEILVSSQKIEMENNAPLGINKFSVKLPYRFKNCSI